MKVTLKKRPGKRGTSLFLAWWSGGKWNYEFLKLRLSGDKIRDRETLRLAEKLRGNREEELESRGRGTAPTFKRKMAFIQYYEGLNKDGKNWQTCLYHLKAFPGARTAIGNVSESWARQFRDFLLERISANSAYVVFSTLKAALSCAVKDRIIPFNPASGVGIKRTEVEIAYLTSAEVKTLAATPCIDPELKRAFLFCCYTGLRYSDVKALQWENYRDGKLNFRQKKTGGFEYMTLPKDRPAEKLLNANRSNMPYIFKMPGKTAVNDNLRKWAAAAGIKKHLHFHMSRHTAATRMLEEGTDLFTVSKILGHSTIATTQRYAKVTDAKKEAAMASLPDISIGLEKPAADESKIEYPEFARAR
jgi:integrase